MADPALRRTVRRCTAVLVLVLALGFDSAAAGFDGTVPAIAALASLLGSGLLGVARRYDETFGLGPPAEGRTDGRATGRLDADE